jgi:curved DNA-binding protein CbpA
MTDKKNAPVDAVASEPPDDIKRMLDELDARIGTIDHYAILGLARTATRAQVRSALLSVAPRFHPDRYFGKKLDADYGAKMKRVFARMAMAHDTLLDEEKRAQYDRGLPPPLPGAPPPLFAAPAPAPSPAPSPPAPPVSTRMAAAAPPPPRPPSSGTMRAPSSPELERARVQAFATRLAGNSSRMRAATPAQAAPGLGRPGGASRGSSPAIPAVDSKAAGEALRRRYEESKAHARTKQSSQELQAAEAATARGDHNEAARLYRVALEHTSDPTAKAAIAQAEQRAKEQGRASAIEQAKSAEEKQEYGQAGIAWARAFDAQPTAETANRAALCFRRAGNDFRRAAKYGEEAVKMEPGKASYHVTLALVYADAGLVLRARGEIERAIALDPTNAAVKEAAAKVKSLR